VAKQIPVNPVILPALEFRRRGSKKISAFFVANFQPSAQGGKSKNLLFNIFFISFHISIYKLFASEKPAFFAPDVFDFGG